MTNRAGYLWMAAGALLCGTGVVTGALGAHALQRVAQFKPDVWDTATHYQQIHGLAIILCAICIRTTALRGLHVAAASFVAGVLMFSGSLYCLSLGGPRWLGPVTPLGGVAFIVGWFTLSVGAWRAWRTASDSNE